MIESIFGQQTDYLASPFLGVDAAGWSLFAVIFFSLVGLHMAIFWDDEE